MNEEDIVNLLQSITDNHAIDSDFGGDSDADDNFALVINSAERSNTRSNASSNEYDSSTSRTRRSVNAKKPYFYLIKVLVKT